MVVMVMNLYPKCFERCPGLCGAMESFMAQYEAKLDAEAVEKQVCATKDQFSCAFQPDGVCQGMLAAGAQFNIPQSGAQLSRRCSGGFVYDQRVNKDASTVARLAWPLLAASVYFSV